MSEIKPVKVPISSTFVSRKPLTDIEYNTLIKEIIVRFDTEPKRYEKKDFGKLIQAIINARGSICVSSEDLEKLKKDLEAYVDSKLDDLVLGEENILEGIRVNGELVPIDENKIADIIFEESEGDSTLTSDFTVNSPIGGISNGTIFHQGDKLEDIIKQMLQRYIGPTASIHIDKPIWEKGATASVNVTYGGYNGSKSVTSVSLNINASSPPDSTKSSAGTYLYIDNGFQTDRTYTVYVEDGTSTKTALASVKFYYPIYKGITTKEIDTLTDEDYKQGYQLGAKPGSVKLTADGTQDARLFFALPSDWKASIIKDSNDFNCTDNYTVKDITINTDYEEGVPYILYIKTDGQSNGTDYSVTLTLK